MSKLDFIKMGLTEERYNQMMNDYDCEAYITESISDWGIETVNKGYDIFDYDNTGMLEIEKIDSLGIFESDEDAALQSIKDGAKIIPINELPENFEYRYIGWIDTPENRKTITEYCDL